MRKFALVVLLIISLGTGAEYANASSPTLVIGVRLHSEKDKTRLVVDLKGPVRYDYQSLGSEFISLDLYSAILDPKKCTFSVDRGLIGRVEGVQFSDKARILLKLREPGFISRVFDLDNPPRVVMDIIPLLPEDVSLTFKTIALDAGHGGKDPGAIGPRGLREKAVTLDIVKRLKVLLEGAGFKVVLTRDRDRFVPLKTRANLAHLRKADLFISIHCNAALSRRARGFEVFYLSPAVNDEARAVAALENSVLELEKKPILFNGGNRNTEAIVWELQYGEFRRESVELARCIERGMARNLPTANRGVKTALFYVLKGVAMPSVLVEVGFISNPYEERRLASASYRQSIARALLKGILSYKKVFEKNLGFTK